MVYPRVLRASPSLLPRVAQAFDAAAFAPALDAKATADARAVALWSARGASAFVLVDGRRTLAEVLGSLLNEPDLVVASEAVEALLSLFVPDASTGGAAENLAVSVDKRGTLFVAGSTLEALARRTKPPDVVRVVPLVKLASLAPLSQAPVLAWPKVVPGHDLVVERAAHAKLGAGALRVRGDEALLGSLRDSALKLPVPRRQLRVRRASNDAFTIADVYAEGFTTFAGAVLAGAAPIPTAAATSPHGARVDVRGENDVAGVTLALKLVPRLDRQNGVTVKFVDQGRRVERLAVGEALFFGPGVDDDVASTVRGHLVATVKGPVLVAGAPLPLVRLDGDVVVVRDG